MALAQEANAYLNETEPWKTAKTDLERTGTSLYVALCAINALKVALYPFLPFSSQRIHEYLGYDGAVEDAGWAARAARAGHARCGSLSRCSRRSRRPAVEGEARLSA